jgi:hypothetical protein
MRSCASAAAATSPLCARWRLVSVWIARRSSGRWTAPNRERDIAAVRQRRETALSDDDLRDVYRSLRADGRGHFAADRLTAQRFGVDRDRVRQAIT